MIIIWQPRRKPRLFWVVGTGSGRSLIAPTTVCAAVLHKQNHIGFAVGAIIDRPHLRKQLFLAIFLHFCYNKIGNLLHTFAKYLSI